MLANLYLQNFKNVVSNNPISAELLQKYNDLCAKIHDKKLAMIDIIYNQDDLNEFEKIAKKISKYEKVLVLGVGGSSLGGKTLTSMKYQNKIQFLESIDPLTVKNCLSEIDFKNTFFLVISKSGETIETVCQTLIILDLIKKEKIADYEKHMLFITQSLDNSLAKIAQSIGAEIMMHPSDIGGRFSCFSIVGMLPALIADIDAARVREGAKIALEHFLSNKENQILRSASIQLDLYRQGYTSSVVMPYIDLLKNFTDWYRQLWAESLGKNHFGSTPINSMGTIDQHSQLQLYLDGPKNKFFTFFTQKETPFDYEINDLEGCKTLFGGKKLSQIVEIEQSTTIEVLYKQKLPIRIFSIGKLDEKVLGALMMQMFLETILIAKSKAIDPFDQPAVEMRKDLAKKLLQV